MRLPDDMAALTEPLAVGLEHARSGEPAKGDIALVVGCGAIGLGGVAGALEAMNSPAAPVRTVVDPRMT